MPLNINDLRQCRCAQTSCGNAAVHKRIAAMPLNTHELRQCRASHDCGNAALHKRFAAMPLNTNDLRQCRASHDCGNAARDMVAAMPLIFFLTTNEHRLATQVRQARAGCTHGAKSRALSLVSATVPAPPVIWSKNVVAVAVGAPPEVSARGNFAKASLCSSCSGRSYL